MKVATHNGRFHADEAFAIAALKTLFPIDYIRTRDEDIIKTCDLRVDVGRKHNPTTGDFDHHQPEGAGKRDNGIPYASFGLVWKHYGHQICRSIEVANKVDASLVQVIDASDSGKDLFKSSIAGVKPCGVDELIDNFMPSWQTNPPQSEVDKDFAKAVDFASQVLIGAINSAKNHLEANKFVLEAIKSAKDERLIILEKHAPWLDAILSKAPKALFVICPAWPTENDDWTLQAINKSLYTYENRKDLPKEWAGKAGTDLVNITGVKGAKFCHAARFMAVADSKKGCLELAKLALKQ